MTLATAEVAFYGALVTNWSGVGILAAVIAVGVALGVWLWWIEER